MSDTDMTQSDTGDVSQSDTKPGMINAPPAAGSSKLNNPMLQALENQLESKLTPENRADYDKVVVAGLHIALDRGPSGFMAKLAKVADPIGDCAKASVALWLIMKKDAKGAMPDQAGIPAAYSLMLHGLDFIDRSGIVKIAEPEIERATTQWGNTLFHRLGISPDMLRHASRRVHQIVQDPDAMAKINLKAGLMRHPGAATPTPIPGITTPAAAAPPA